MRTRWKILIVILTVILIGCLWLFVMALSLSTYQLCEIIEDVTMKEQYCCHPKAWGCPHPGAYENSNNEIVNKTRSTMPPPESGRILFPHP